MSHVEWQNYVNELLKSMSECPMFTDISIDLAYVRKLMSIDAADSL